MAYSGYRHSLCPYNARLQRQATRNARLGHDALKEGALTVRWKPQLCSPRLVEPLDRTFAGLRLIVDREIPIARVIENDDRMLLQFLDRVGPGIEKLDV
jgi:hypothetical protein